MGTKKPQNNSIKPLSTGHSFARNCIKPSKKLATRAKWYTPELENLKNIVMILFVFPKQLAWSDVNSYKIALYQAKKKYNENFIATASNKYKAAWQVIQMESFASSATHTAPDADINKSFTAGVEEAGEVHDRCSR
ncbi:hypothetical protein J6590_009590 [Homalodisca vitripennis]|nr:hypothetical protein J6590_009590 [Homalodisca vitripennis]